jgi:hypothetical protein
MAKPEDGIALIIANRMKKGSPSDKGKRPDGMRSAADAFGEGQDADKTQMKRDAMKQFISAVLDKDVDMALDVFEDMSQMCSDEPKDESDSEEEPTDESEQE